MSIKRGDVFTIQGVMQTVRNPDRRWWRPWKPRMAVSEESQAFKVTSIG